jgi:hypothetical protein
MMWLIRCFWVDGGDQQRLEHYASPLVREGLGPIVRGCEAATWGPKTLGSLRVSQVFLLLPDTVT